MQPAQSNTALILIGLCWVNFPVVILMMAPFVAAQLAISGYGKTVLGSAVAIGALVAGFALAWTWWSFATPRWRLWAFARASSISRLKARAVGIGLIWREGHRFERTEFRSPDYAQKLAAITSAAALAGRQ